jgi:cathepsin L
MRKHQPAMSASEMPLRANLFESTKERVRRYSQDHRLEGNFHVDHPHAAKSFEEMSAYAKCYKAGKSTTIPEVLHFDGELPETVDWRTKGVVTGVKDQGDCGGCWAFSSTGNLEGLNALQTGNLTSLSEQNLIDCSNAPTHPNSGCDGGRVDWSLMYVSENKGIDTEQSYPYTARDGSCHFDRENVAGTCTGYKQVQERNETALQVAVATIGPISIAIDVTDPFANYHSGVFYDPDCQSGEMNLDHAVLIVGYGVEEGKKYWLVKNSWGASWGDKGYIKMARDRDNNCGVATQAFYGTL